MKKNVKSFIVLLFQSLQHKVQQEKMEVDNLSNRTEEMIERGPQCLYTSEAMDVIHRFRAASESINVSFNMKSACIKILIHICNFLLICMKFGICYRARVRLLTVLKNF